LLEEVVLEDKLRRYLEKLQHCNALDACMIARLHKIPCILHCEIWVGIKLLTMFLMECFSNVQQGLIFFHIRSINDHISVFAGRIQTILNTEILGDEDGPTQWQLPMDGEGKNVGIICLDDNQIRKMVNKLELLMNISFADKYRRIKYQYSIPHYRDGMFILHHTSFKCI
jgi:hypothetical protein